MPTLALPPAALLPFALLLLAAIGLWIHRALWMGALVAALIVGYATGALHGLAAIWTLLLAALVWNYRTRSRFEELPLAGILKILSALVLFAFAAGMGLGLLPGFPRIVLVAGLRLTPDALPYDI